jgi:hypothetical protein
MNYKKMLCWVRPNEKKELEKAVGNKFSVFFVKTKKDFLENINKDVFPVISLKNAYQLNALYKIVRKFPTLIFYIMRQDIDYEPITGKESAFLDEPNIFVYKNKRSNFNADELIAIFEGQDIIV